ncbi:MAG: hypothetical protein IKN74_05830 [Clostridia bacterium]|nr:hypothetical protein [Clostridia bacterium]
MKGMKFTKKVKKILALTFVFSILQNHLLVLSDVQNRVYATSTSLESTVTNDEKNVKSSLDEETKTESKKDEKTSQSTENTSIDSVLSDVIDDSDDALFDPRVDQLKGNREKAEAEKANAVEKVETVEESTNEETEEEPINSEVGEESEVKEAEETQDVEESFEAKLDIQNSYKYADGVVLEGIITLDVKNLEGYIESAEYEIALDEIEGYTVKNIYVDKVETFEEESFETHATSDSSITGKVTYDGVSNTAKYEIKATFVLEGKNDSDDFSLNCNCNEKIVHEDKSVYEDEFNASSTVELKGEDLETKYSLTTENNSIYKGYLYANAETETEYETTYNSTSKIELKDVDNVSYALVTESNDILVDDKDEEFTLRGVNEYVKTFIETEEFEKLFGEDGYIEIYSNGKLLGRIDAANEVKDGHYEYTYNEPISNAEFKLVGLKDSGTLNIKSDKVIKDSSIFTTEKVKSLKSIKQSSEFKKVNVLKEEEYVLEQITAENKINLEETESKVDISLDNESLSSSSVTETSMLLELRTDEEKYNLFKNPTIKIEFPSDVKSIEILNVNLLYKNGLSLDKYDLVEENGKQVLNISLLGTQTEYTSGLLNRGTLLNIDLKIKLDRLTTNKSSLIKMTYTNEIGSTISYEKAGNTCEELEVNYQTKMGLLKTLSVANNLTGETSMIYDTENDDTQLAMDSANQVIDFKGTVVNNYDTEINNMVIVGKIPGAGVQDANRNDLVSTFDATLKEEVLTNGLSGEVYYSESINPDKDDSSWEKSNGNIEKYRSFKIVVDNTTVNQGERIEFSYKVNIPDNISYNQKGYTTYTIYYEMEGSELFGVCSGKLITEEKELTIEDIEEQEIENFSNLAVGSQVTIGDKVLTEADTINEGQIVKYTLIVTNNGRTSANNIKISASAENANLYYKKYTHFDNYQGTGLPYDVFEFVEDKEGEHLTEEFTIDNLAAGESKTFTYQAVVKNINEIQGEMAFGKIDITADDMDSKHVETIKNKIVDADLGLITRYAFTENDDDKLSVNYDYNVTVDVRSYSDEELQNIAVNVYLPNDVELMTQDPVYPVIKKDSDNDIKYYYTVSKNINGTVFELVIEKLDANDKIGFQINTMPKKVDSSIAEVNIRTYSSATYNNRVYNSNIHEKTIYQDKIKLNYEWLADREAGSLLENNDIVNFELKLKNDGLVDSGTISLTSDIPRGLEVTEVKIEKNGVTSYLDTEDFPKVIVAMLEKMSPNEEMDVKLKYVVKYSRLAKDQDTIENNVQLVGKSIDMVTTDVISFNVDNKKTEISSSDTVKASDTSNTTNKTDNTANSNDTTQKQTNTQEKKTLRYVISGAVWEDSNKNGIKEGTESPIYGVGVFAYKVNDSGKTEECKATAVTNEKGEYKIENVEPGDYVVVFGFDSSIYNVTTYKVASAKSINSSDATSKRLNDNSKVAMTDVISITNMSKSNINLGLYKINGFDLAIEKYISNVTVTNAKGKQVTEFKRSDPIAKVEIHSKLFENSTVDIEYRIVVKNEGQIDGYANRIVDYLPEGLTFDQAKNPNWSLNGNELVYTGFVDRTIPSGKEIETSLYLTKKVDSIRTNSIENSAEILESTTESGLVDVDSTVGNKSSLEDDFDKAVLLITVSTGAVVNRLLIVIAVLSIIGIALASRLIFRKKFYR